MSDVTRQPGGTPVDGGMPVDGGTHAERGRQSPDVRADTTPGLDPAPALDTTPARSENAGTPAATQGHGGHVGHGGALLPHEECDKLGQRLQHAVAGFVDAPRASVEEADRVLEEIGSRVTDAVTHHRRTLRTSWRDTGEAEHAATSTDTEQLRLALRDYRELADRLMRL